MMRAIGMERPAEVIEWLRVERGLTRSRASTLGGLSQTTWRAVESGSSANPHPSTKVRIARALGVMPSAIWRPRPRPLHLWDVEDPRWEAAARATARRLDHEGSLQERQRFGRQLIAVLDHADRGGSCDPDSGEGPWEDLWQLASSLVFDPQATPITIIDGKLVERELESFTEALHAHAIAARRRRLRACSK